MHTPPFSQEDFCLFSPILRPPQRKSTWMICNRLQSEPLKISAYSHINMGRCGSFVATQLASLCPTPWAEEDHLSTCRKELKFNPPPTRLIFIPITNWARACYWGKKKGLVTNSRRPYSADQRGTQFPIHLKQSFSIKQSDSGLTTTTTTCAKGWCTKR